MNAAAASARVPETNDYVNSWATSLSEVLAEKLGSPVPCNILSSSSDVVPISEDDTWLTVTIAGHLKGELAFRLPMAVRQRFASHPYDGGSQPGDVDGLMLEIFELSAARVQTRLEPGCEVKHRVEKTQPPSWNPHSIHILQVQFANPVLVELRLEKTLIESLQSIGLTPPTPQVPVSVTGAEKLGMLMEVELAVTMRFGGKKMLLKDILDLCTGSVVELDQQVQEPVDLLLDGRLVARGEVVVVEGNYGLRVTEVISGNEK
jgi:flagellar motor switch protein FliN